MLEEAPDGARPRVSFRELRGLVRLGFPEVARRVAAGTCPECGLNRTSPRHHASCEEPKAEKLAAAAPRQPWEPKPPEA